MVIRRGDIWWADLGEPQGSKPGFRRPVVVVQANSFNESKIATVIVAVLTSNTHLAEAPGNFLLSVRESGLKKFSVVNISQLMTLDKDSLTQFVKRLNAQKMQKVEFGLKLIFEL